MAEDGHPQGPGDQVLGVGGENRGQDGIGFVEHPTGDAHLGDLQG